MIEIKNLYKKFGSLAALSDVNIQFKNSSLNYLVGPNGSGKTTLIKCILGLVKPTSGEIFVDGVKLNGNYKYKEKIGYMPQIAHFPENLTVREIISTIQNLRSENIRYDEELIENFKLNSEMDKRLKNLSGGTRQKVNAAIAFLFDPQILILDEPTAGLDPVSSSILKDKIIAERKRGKTIIFTSHILSELEELAENVVFLLEGKIYYNGTISHLIEKTKGSNLERAIASIMSGEAA
ncbi:ABC transporter ATP-binding protein [Melioribacteraceae bacterium 4301-Me]|uniref:ABC transporter ATP-binding protein n=1 Tax=Pyranulibacter aquaticus TaxID=3163344 RepID=UPI003598A711